MYPFLGVGGGGPFLKALVFYNVTFLQVLKFMGKTFRIILMVSNSSKSISVEVQILSFFLISIVKPT